MIRLSRTTARLIWVSTANVDYVASSTTVTEVAEKLAAGDYGALPVYEGDRLVVMITDRDIVVKIVAKGLDPATTTVGDRGQAEVLTTGPDDSIHQAMLTMAEH